MKAGNITPENTVFIVISFEGRDPYSLAGGLGVRVTNLSEALADMGFPVHVFFIGDPKLPGEEICQGGRLVLHRWCQWISQYHPNGVYDGEEGKLSDFNQSLPKYIVEHITTPAISQGKLVAILGEEWQTTEAMCRISDLLHQRGLRDKAILFWNANNTLSFNRIDWGRLNYTTRITTVSRYMKHIMWGMGLNPLVIPNGIPASLLRRVDEEVVERLKEAFGAGLVLFKMARWHPDKRWNVAIEAVARLKRAGLKPLLVARGGLESYGSKVTEQARSLGLKVRDAMTESSSFDDHISVLSNAAPADVINVRFHVPPKLSRVLYRASDGVLANSGHEPFGLVGLEAMAAGGIAYTGCTGEDYAIPFVNCFMLETDDPDEIACYASSLKNSPEDETRMRRLAKRTARQFTWESTIQNLLSKLDNQARVQGIGSGFLRPQRVAIRARESEGPRESLPLWLRREAQGYEARETALWEGVGR